MPISPKDVIPHLTLLEEAGRGIADLAAGKTVSLKALKARQTDDVREFVVDDYLALYLLRGREIIFLAIKHHRQISFDLRRFWA